MSNKNPKDNRFTGQLASLAGRPQVEEQTTPPDSPAKSNGPNNAAVDDDLESFSSHMTRERKRRLKMAAGREDRKMYQIVAEAVEKYLSEHHPDLK